MARPHRSCGPFSRTLSLLVLLTLPSVLLQVGEPLSGDDAPVVTQHSQDDAPSFGLAPAETGEDAEDDCDDVLPHDFIVESARASHKALRAARLLRSMHATERLLRPPIG
jgi:hypothetical protein